MVLSLQKLVSQIFKLFPIENDLDDSHLFDCMTSKSVKHVLDIVHANSGDQQRKLSRFLNQLRNLIIDGSKSVKTILEFIHNEENKTVLNLTNLGTRIHKGQTLLHLAVLHPRNKACTVLHHLIQHRCVFPR